MPLSSSASSFFGKLGPQEAGPLTNQGNPAQGIASASQFKTPNLFDTIQAVRQNELDRQAKQAQIATVLQELAMAPQKQAYQQAQMKKLLYDMDPNNIENQIKIQELSNKQFDQGINASKQGLREVGPIEARRLENRALFKTDRTALDSSQKPISIGGRKFSLDPRLSQELDAIVYDPNTGKYYDNDGNLVSKIGKNQKVRNLAISPETFGARAAATGAEGQKFFKEPEIVDMRDIGDTASSLREVRKGLSDLGINPAKLGGVEMETVDSNLGPMSIPARFNLVGQYAKDPKYTAIKYKLERAFNKYRKIITGAQASQGELIVLRNSFARFNDRPEVFFENLNALEGETSRILSDRLDLYDDVGRDTSKIRSRYKIYTGSDKVSDNNNSGFEIVGVRNE